MVLRIATLNSRGGDSKTDHILKLLKEAKIDICLLQETHDMKVENTNKIAKALNVKIYKNPGTYRGRGVITIVKESESLKNSRIKSMDDKGNSLIIEIEIDNEILEIVNLYGPLTPANRRKLYKELSTETEGKTNRIIGGDFNNIFDFNLDCCGGSIHNFEKRKSDREILKELETKHGYKDTFRYLYPQKKAYTFSGISNYKSRLDRFYIHSSYANCLTEAGIKPVYFSDHDLYVIDVKSENETERKKWGKGIWKLNKTLLDEENNLETLKNLWSIHRQTKHIYESLTDWWEIGKRKIKQKCIEIGKSERKIRDDRKERLAKELEALTMSSNAATAKRILEIKREINSMEEKEIEGAILRSKTDWQNQGERCSKYFFNLEKSKGREKQIEKLYDENSKIITSKEDILQYTKKYFEQEFSDTEIDMSHCHTLIDSLMHRLSDQERKDQSGPFTMNELDAVKKKMKSNSSPGNDGLTSEFYDRCWNFISHDLLDVINEASVTGRLPLSMTQAIITLIYKNKGERERLKNWRAISLLNVDFKYITGMISARIDPHLPKLIHRDQACGVRNRFLEDPLIYIQEMLDYIRQYGGHVMICCLDLMAAFNNVHHLYMNMLYERLNFSYGLRDLLSTIYRNMYSAIVINGAKTRYFKLYKSIRQGDKTSMCNFILAIEPFANIIRRDTRIHPVILPNTEPKSVCMYCDDTTIISSDTDDLEIIKDHMNTFEKGTGGKFNPDKTEILLAGKWTANKRNKVTPIHLKENITILGVNFGIKSDQLNNQKILNKIEETLKFWRTLPLSFEGKRLIIMTKVVSQLYHIIRIRGLNATLKKEVQKIMSDFIWHPKRMRMIAYDTLQNSTDQGGLEMPNLDNINRAILTERLCKVMKGGKEWEGIFIYRLGTKIRPLSERYNSPTLLHSRRTTPINAVIAATYDELKNKVEAWEKEDFASLKRKLHSDNDYRKANQNKDYSQTWKELRTSTDNRRRRDISYLAAHNSLPVCAVLKRRNVVTDASCKLCRKNEETREHLFYHCSLVQELRSIINTRLGKTLSEMEIIYHEGRAKFKKKSKNMIAIYKQVIWQIRAKIYYGELKTELEIKNAMKYAFLSKL